MPQNGREHPRFEYVADGVFRLAVAQRDAINVYLIDDILIDAGARQAGPKILRALDGIPLRGHVVTHGHPDHQGASHHVCTTLDVPLWCGAADRKAVESGDLTSCYPRPDKFTARIPTRLWGGPAHPVERTLIEGDEVADFEVLEVPGHTAGHIALWRARDGVAIVGDVLFGMNPFTLRRRLRQPPTMFTVNPDQNRESIRKLAALKPQVLCFGHGRPIYGRDLLAEFVSSLPAVEQTPASILAEPDRAAIDREVEVATPRTPVAQEHQALVDESTSSSDLESSDLNT